MKVWIVAQTNYQDIYRITDGVLFIVNKFVPIDYSNLTDERIHIYRKEAKYKSYNKNCQNWLKVLKEDYKYEYCPIIAPKGTVTVRSKANSFEARVTLDLTAIMEGVEKNPRLSRTAKTEKEARQRLGEEIANIYFKIQKQIHSDKVFSDECSKE